jgi:c(7)-type cytochrome triheme protein
MKKIGLLLTVVCMALLLGRSAGGRTLPPPEDYGKVIISNFSAGAQLAPVRFDHWLHRAFYTCRLCHIDLGFAMERNGTRITAEMNEKGFYCGSCHNGSTTHDGKPIFKSCSKEFSSEEKPRCLRCHTAGGEHGAKYNYASFVSKFPQLKLGNLVDWEEAETRGFIRPADFLPGPSTRRSPLKAQADFSITSRGTWMPDIIFSHKKHALWNGCEVCHPDVFPSVKKNTVKYSMFQIHEGEYCGLCHRSVAFPLEECQRCHAAKGASRIPDKE